MTLVCSVVRFNKRPWTLNAERRMHYMTRAALVREWREAFMMLARVNQVIVFKKAVVIVQPYHSKGPRQDVDACHPAAKAAIDGLVDAGVLISDGPEHLIEIRYMASIHDSVDGLSLIICQPSEGNNNDTPKHY